MSYRRASDYRFVEIPDALRDTITEVACAVDAAFWVHRQQDQRPITLDDLVTHGAEPSPDTLRAIAWLVEHRFVTMFKFGCFRRELRLNGLIKRLVPPSVPKRHEFPGIPNTNPPAWTREASRGPSLRLRLEPPQ